MKITQDKPMNIDAYVRNAEESGKTKPQAGADVKGMVAEDKVNISSKAREIQEAKEFIKALPDVREEKVLEIQKKIESGTYQMDGREIAFKMLKESIINESA